jgi:hypothetical protein
MAEFGWAYVSGSNLPQGVDKAVQVKSGDEFNGNSNFTYDTSTNELILSGNMYLSGTLFANEFTTNVTSKNVINLSATGSTSFGDTTDDIHNFTGVVNLTAAADSALVYQNTSDNEYLTSSNPSDLATINANPDTVNFIKAVNPALVVSGAAVFNDPVSIQGGLFGASPIDVFAPLRYKAANDADDLLIQRGKFIGRVEISSSNAEHGLFMEGAARIKATTTQATSADLKPEMQFINNVVDQTTYPVIDLRKYDNITVEQHPQIDGYGSKMRRHDQYTIGDVHFATKLPILTGSDASDLSNYELTDFRISRITTTVDARRNAYQLNFLTAHTEFDPEYEEVFAVSGSGEGSSVREVSSSLSSSFSSSQHNTDPNSTVNTLIVGSFANPGQGNRYGLKRGIMVGGNILPLGANLTNFGGGSNHSTYEGTIGHPAARWGDLYVHDNRYIRWGQQASNGNYRDFFQTDLASAAGRNEENTVLLGFSTSSNMLEITGSPLLADGGLNITGSGYINFGLTTGSTGYGLRDNNGTLEFRNSGGESWAEFGTGTGDSTIGAAEDGSYTDGLFTDFVTTTLVGVPIDRFNEVLKILAPSPAPALSRVNFDNSAGSTVKLSFGTANVVSDYTSSNTAAGFTAVDVNGTYENETSGDNFRLGVYKNDTDITGFLNFHVVESTQNGYVSYSNDAFGNAETGSLKLELNGNIIHTVDLTGLTGTGNPFVGSANSLTGDSGFTNVSVTASSFDGNNSEWYIFKHRTAKVKVDVNDMVPGWNYVRAIHTVGATDYATNYVEWINDPSGSTNDLSVTNERIEDITLVGSKYVSGVQYNTDATANYKVDINNLYRNIYAASGTPVSFTVTNSTTPSPQGVPSINTGAGEDHTKILGITASLDYNSNSLVNGAITANVTVTHPFKSTISTVGSATTGNGFLIDNRTLASTNTSEKFHDETFRKTSGSYDAQGNVTAGTALWSSQNHMTDGGASGHTDGLLMFNQRLYSPVDGDIPAAGDFSSIANAESGQPDYSGVTGTRTFYRSIQNTSDVDLYNFVIESNKNGTTYNNSSLGTGNVHVFVKIPGTTGWMDATQAFTYGNTSDGDGALISAASDSDTHVVSFGTTPVIDDDYIMLKILADESWSGYISQLDFTLPGNQSQATPEVLSDINATQTGTTVKLSFGTLSNSISGYSNVDGSGVGSLSDVNSNGLYSVSGDRRGAFDTAELITGTVNDAIGGGSGYPVDAFFNGYSGNLVLEVNGVDVHTIDLTSTLNTIANDFNGNSSGFDLSAVNFSTLSNIPHYTKPYRTGTYQIGTADQRNGWNYARVKHGSNTTNYVEWVVDPSGAVDNTAVNTPVLSDFDHSDIYYQSGIKYFASRPSASFAYSGSNFYSNVYSRESDAISFGTTDRCSISNIRAVGTGVTTFDSGVSQTTMPALNNNDDCETTTLQVTGTVLFDNLTSISGGLGRFTDYDVSVASTLKHPFKTNRTTSTSSKTSFMVYSGSIGSTNLNTNEHFNTEDYRIVSGNYINQAAATDGGNAWNPQTQMNAANAHGDGMVTVNGYAISPFQIGKAGDTRNNSEGSTGLQAPAGNPNYSVLSDDVRTYYRYFRNETGLAKATGFSVKLYGDAYLCAKGGSFYTGTLGENKNINVELKVPFDPAFTGLDDTSTAWGDVVRPYQAGVQPDADGIGIYSGGNTDLNQTVDSNGRAIGIQLLEKQIRDDQYFVLKISAHKNWTGYLSRIEIVY